MNSNFLHVAAFACVMLCWFGFVLAFFLRHKPPRAAERTRDSTSRIGIALQGVGYAVIWAVQRRPPFVSPFLSFNRWLDLTLACAAVVVAAGSVWLVMSAMRTLGKEWSLTARLVEGHRLVTTGLYARVRHPIYTGMFGLLLATGLVVSHWIGLLIGIVVFWIGTIVRVRSEERLLRESFGAEFETYARRVPAVLPGIY